MTRYCSRKPAKGCLSRTKYSTGIENILTDILDASHTHTVMALEVVSSTGFSFDFSFLHTHTHTHSRAVAVQGSSLPYPPQSQAAVTSCPRGLSRFGSCSASFLLLALLWIRGPGMDCSEGMDGKRTQEATNRF